MIFFLKLVFNENIEKSMPKSKRATILAINCPPTPSLSQFCCNGDSHWNLHGLLEETCRYLKDRIVGRWETFGLF